MQNYMPRLDGLRAVAVGIVLVTHFWSALLPGEIGVRIFFVLSGYLITRILLGYRKTSLSVGKAAAHFYWRRFLRLTPAQRRQKTMSDRNTPCAEKGGDQN
jgi:peptidoglycan/LPS O-acetylase OafA/YrhL